MPSWVAKNPGVSADCARHTKKYYRGTYDERGNDQSNGDTFVLDLFTECFGPSSHKRLGSGVHREQRGWNSSSERSNVEDQAVVGLDHLRENEFGNGEGRVDVL